LFTIILPNHNHKSLTCQKIQWESLWSCKQPKLQRSVNASDSITNNLHYHC